MTVGQQMLWKVADTSLKDYRIHASLTGSLSTYKIGCGGGGMFARPPL